jgi:hypothetical protein
MSNQKEYWIRLFIKKCISLNHYEAQMNFFIGWCGKTYNVSGDLFDKIREEYTIDNYIDKLIPIIDKYFTVEDLKASIKFYSSDAGKKILGHQFLEDMGKVGQDMGKEIEDSFSRKQ